MARTNNLNNYLTDVITEVKRLKKSDYFDLGFDYRIINGYFDNTHTYVSESGTGKFIYNDMKRVSYGNSYTINSDITLQKINAYIYNIKGEYLNKVYSNTNSKSLTFSITNIPGETDLEDAYFLVVSVENDVTTINTNYLESISLSIVDNSKPDIRIDGKNLYKEIYQLPMLYKFKFNGYNSSTTYNLCHPIFKETFNNELDYIMNNTCFNTGTKFLFYNNNCLTDSIYVCPRLMYFSSKSCDLNAMFSGCNYVEHIKLDVLSNKLYDYLNNNKVPTTDIQSIAYNCSHLEDIEINAYFSSINMGLSFYNCSNLKTINIRDLRDTKSFRLYPSSNFTHTFYNCSNLEHIYGLDYLIYGDNAYFKRNSSKTYGNYLFAYCKKLDFSNIPLNDLLEDNTSLSPTYMFCYCENLRSITIPTKCYCSSNSASHMFDNCSNLTSFISNDSDNFKNITNFSGMFYNCVELDNINLDINTSNSTITSMMFLGCSKLSNITFGNNFILSNPADIFKNCPLLSNNSLNNILALCIKSTNQLNTLNLAYLGLTETQANLCTSLSNWAECESLGWTTGY